MSSKRVLILCTKLFNHISYQNGSNLNDVQAFLASPEAEKNAGAHSTEVVLLVFNLLFLYFLTLNGLARSLSDLSGLTKKSGAIPRGNWLLIVCGE